MAWRRGGSTASHFDIAVLTNLSRDHLDYHGDMDSYAAAKARLFNWPGLEYAVLNLDDAFGAATGRQARSQRRAVAGYGFEAKRDGAVGDRLRSVADAACIAARCVPPGATAEIEQPLLGRFNAANLLAVLAALLVSGVTLDDACAALAHRSAGRRAACRRLGGEAQPLVVVDYAHTPDALEKVLATLREIVSGGRLICVFGCGGDRDRGKRPLMGAVASRLADRRSLVTSDNPRSEDPRAHHRRHPRRHAAPTTMSIDDRARAIDEAIARGAAGRRGADRRQGPRGLSGNRGRAAAVLRCRSGAEGAGGHAT